MCMFAGPMLVYLTWSFTRSDSVPASCEQGTVCQSPRMESLLAFLDAVPNLAGALALAILTSLLLRPLSRAWRPGTVAFASATIGAALVTLVTSVLT